MRLPIITGALAVSLIASGLTFASTSTGQGARPDLVVSSISNPPAVAFQGHAFDVTDRTRNIGGATARATVTAYYLSSNGNRTAVGRRFVVRLRPERSSRGLSHAMILDSVGPGIYSLVACADGKSLVRESNERNNCRTATTKLIVKKPPPPV